MAMKTAQERRLNIDMSPQLHRALKARCARDGVTMRVFVLDLIHQHFKSDPDFCDAITGRSEPESFPLNFGDEQ